MRNDGRYGNLLGCNEFVCMASNSFLPGNRRTLAGIMLGRGVKRRSLLT